MALFAYKDAEALGSVRSVDTATVVVGVQNMELLRKLQVNRLVALQSSRAGQHLIGIVQRITRVPIEVTPDQGGEQPVVLEENSVKVALIGTLIDKVGTRENVFRRTLESVPEIDAYCFPLETERLTGFMKAIAASSPGGEAGLLLGTYALDEAAEAILDGNRFFQRHAAIVGSTGSGKSWTVATILEQAARLANTNAILFDVHGEYTPLSGTAVRHFRVAGPTDLGTPAGLGDGVIYLPYWLLGYEDMIAWLVDRSDQNAPNQAMVLSRAVIAAKQESLKSNKRDDLLANFTIDSPVPYALADVLAEIQDLNSEMVAGAKAGTEKQGEFHGRLSRFIARLENRSQDRRLGFMFGGGAATQSYNYLAELSGLLMAGTRDQPTKAGGIKVLDFSEVPSDILPLIVSLVARMVFSVQQWTKREQRQPIALFCDEAHLYMPNDVAGGGVADAALRTFQRIAKEGRKYGVGLVVISQRPSEVSRTVLSQCNNFVAMRLTNAEDQTVVKRLLPDSLGGFGDLLPILDTGEALVVGDASLLPSRVRVAEPASKPSSATVAFWDCWAADAEKKGIEEAVTAWRRQSQH